MPGATGRDALSLRGTGMDLKGTFRNLSIGSEGVRFERMSLLDRLRAWALRKLDAIDRASAQKFGHEFMQPNGRAVHTLTDEFVAMDDLLVRVPRGAVGIAIAPWVRDCRLGNVTIIGDDYV
jgi:hypothetical protein